MRRGSRHARSSSNTQRVDTQRVLVIAAHPDDEVLGCGATLAKYAERHHDVFSLILGEGMARGSNKIIQDLGIRELRKESERANRILGVRKVYRYSFPDNRFDSVPLLEIVKAIESVKSEVGPTIVFTHHAHDVNIDHQIAFKASLAAFRPLPGETVREFYCFQTVSSTEWQASNCGLVFLPTHYEDVAATMDKKVRAVKAYASELRNYPHPRSTEGVLAQAVQMGLRVGLEKAEAFELIRKISR
jgi:LmbE family N-acetylglucosaminyl deacetylase